LKEQTSLDFENIADILWLSKFTGMQSVVAENIETKKEKEPKQKPKIEDEVEEKEDDLEIHTDNQDEEKSSPTKQKKAKAIQSPKKLALSNYREWESLEYQG